MMRRRTGLLLVVAVCHGQPTVAQLVADSADFGAVRRYLERAVGDGAFPGGVLVVGHTGRIVLSEAVGHYGVDDPRAVSDSTVYDLASLTKVIGLTTAVMVLVADGRLDLDRPVREYVPTFAGDGRDLVTVRHLLLHTSGLPAWQPLYRETRSREELLHRVLTTPLDTTPGARYRYSDLGAIVLTHVVESVAGEPLDRFLTHRVFEPLGMHRTAFRPPESWRPFVAPTERDPWRGRVLVGEVHDENTARLGGVSGHAGLFAAGPDLATFAFWLFDAYHDRPRPEVPIAVPGSMVREFARRQNQPAGSTRALGWDTPSAAGSSAGHCLGSRSFGHTGFTGTSIWLDPDRDLVLILLTNRVHPSRENPAIRRVRSTVADLVVRALEPTGGCGRQSVDTLPGAP